MQYVFFGTDNFSVIVLEELKKAGSVPALVVTATDKKMGRGMRLTSPPVKLWAQKSAVQFLQPQKLDDSVYYSLQSTVYKLFVVASYGKIIPKRFLDIPAHGALNVHPSLLPLYRGPSPLESQILDGADERGEVGVTIMQMDEEMDHGPILAQQELGQVQSSKFKVQSCAELQDALAHLGGQLLAETIPKWLAGEITPREQEHEKATYTEKITKADGLISLDDDAEKNYRKFRAFTPWPSVYFFDEKNRRVKITDAALEEGKFVIKKVIPEGKKEVRYEDFLRCAE
ncbi:methionyl-tRNA formyltransferase [Candidatus Kaiserbacteria bacterium RIFCSPLOWO2_01_FULL_53_17]|uniref:methionyl-tRNA formyltransferase n=1 Tax=Candidatus Kaiserbacteria bacterium RIFCSPLOWO2_01_FULL_53_17 TaxID=1798511 RepID=A0A1F6EGP8_9BACT|nr:MAG: methionyl-tRNA formyltransferase [Candidatus Kaiserbacteria bacterium RIFCSPLOWO2_01_FULL_53_17]